MPIPKRICALAGASNGDKPTTFMTRPAFRAACKARHFYGMGNKLQNKYCMDCGFRVRVNEGKALGDPPGGIAFISLKKHEELKKKVNASAAIEKTKFFRKFQAKAPSFTAIQMP